MAVVLVVRPRATVLYLDVPGGAQHRDFLVAARDLAKLQVRRTRSNRSLLLSSPLLWALLIIVVPHGLFGVDVYQLFGMAWVFLAFGVAVLVAAVFVSRTLQGRTAVSELLRRLGDDIAGRRMAEAASRLDEIAAFETR